MKSRALLLQTQGVTDEDPSHYIDWHHDRVAAATAAINAANVPAPGAPDVPVAPIFDLGPGFNANYPITDRQLMIGILRTISVKPAYVVGSGLISPNDLQECLVVRFSSLFLISKIKRKQNYAKQRTVQSEWFLFFAYFLFTLIFFLSFLLFSKRRPSPT
jgi:hypothetical protein